MPADGGRSGRSNTSLTSLLVIVCVFVDGKRCAVGSFRDVLGKMRRLGNNN